MRLFSHWLPSIALLCGLKSVLGASSWGFGDATVSIQSKGAGVGGGFKEKLTISKPLSKPVALAASDTIKILLTAQEDKTPKRPHQAFLNIKDVETGLETSYPLSVKESGKGKVELTHKDLPTQFLTSSKPLDASLVIASFGSSTPYNRHAFDLSIKLDPNAPFAVPEKPLRYGKLPEIHHTFKADPKSPPKIITLVFTAAVIAALPLFLGTWLSFGANLNHLPRALQSAPVAHTLFYGSILALEGIFFMYYTSWNLFQTLPAAAGVGAVTFLSGSRALSEVQERRLAGLR
ncbi:hypothetical protein MMC16_006435 [Acarospora aff. strigata]|nr:hypothetical protein [Acarospora aff. strigata]